jgi:hypothetical protein
VQFVAFAVVAGPPLQIEVEDLAHREPFRGVVVHHDAHLPEVAVHIGMAFVHGVVVVSAIAPGSFGDVGEVGVLPDEVSYVDPEPVDTAIQPEPHHVVHGGAHLGVAPLEIRLRRQEGMQVPLPGRFVPLPRRSAEDRPPVVRRHARSRAVPPHVPVALRVRSGRSGLPEPGVLARGVVRHQVDDQLHCPVVHGAEQSIEGVQVPEDRMDVAVVGDVVPEVVHR